MSLPSTEKPRNVPKESGKYGTGSVFWLLLAIVVVFAAWWLSQYAFFVRPEFNSDNPGQFGDSFGAVNALFSGLAFVGVIYAVYLQRQDLRLQMKELAETQAILRAQQEEVAAQRKQAELQTKTFTQQGFESTFFQLIRLRQDVVGSLTDHRNRSGLNGSACLPLYQNRLREFFGIAVSGGFKGSTGSKPPQEVEISEFYRHFWSESAPYLEPLIKITQATLSLINSATEISKETYVQILRSCMWRGEFILLLYHARFLEIGGSDDGLPDLLIGLRLVSGIPEQELLDPSHVEWMREFCH